MAGVTFYCGGRCPRCGLLIVDSLHGGNMQTATAGCRCKAERPEGYWCTHGMGRSHFVKHGERCPECGEVMI